MTGLHTRSQPRLSPNSNLLYNLLALQICWTKYQADVHKGFLLACSCFYLCFLRQNKRMLRSHHICSMTIRNVRSIPKNPSQLGIVLRKSQEITETACNCKYKNLSIYTHIQYTFTKTMAHRFHAQEQRYLYLTSIRHAFFRVHIPEALNWKLLFHLILF